MGTKITQQALTRRGTRLAADAAVAEYIHEISERHPPAEAGADERDQELKDS